ncbi:alpha-D-ribose 1-methylphosphonate 5-triphosphate synthase subunit PhnL [Cytobacillus firmus]|uniref:Alpha-D-ribose 1-methylphosphonate 5-triphosphate synthase subunit PhnL n=2 Tax=Cytobacillus TaxID=2675230 RepID=A0A366K4L6_CYTFI|nr:MULTISPECIES: ATP-binding cassette domain-containing protein [Cytobacillus]RBP96043.1 alpha-D-ribose 1-methylphosphonate 5-triphosphate synthase subunit PhnL [Cytobacillus firmus]TDX44956.1 alpha-D-ribose 1-methylphosphonate 5-triphosphate synthase subunit PhnL [Cytobacillus oceanisediminis]
MENLLEIRELSKSFTLHNLGKNVHAVSGIDIRLGEGDFVGITGKSGSGKSTILKCIFGTYRLQQGSIWYNSKKFGPLNIAEATNRQMIYLRKHEIGYVSQFLTVMPRTTARQLVKQAIVEMGRDQVHAEKETEQILSHFELDPELWDSYPATFSGGEKLRLNIARAMVKKPRLLLLDEPTASLDYESKIKVKILIEQLMHGGTSMLGIFHDLEFMNNLCDREYNMQNGVFTLSH